MTKSVLVNVIGLIAIVGIFIKCHSKAHDRIPLPFFGKSQKVQILIDGVLKDTLLAHQIPDFELTNQYNETFNNADLKGKVYLTEFFFTSCPSVCPKVAKQMKAIHNIFPTDSDFALVSFTLDSKRDTPDRLFDYAQKKDVNHSNWYFLTGEKDTIYTLAEEGFFVAAYDDTTRIDDNIMHDGVLVLVDHQGHVRGMFDGKESTAVAQVESAVKQLLLDVPPVKNPTSD